jgi:DNA-binding CsgD family transcriptional regulator
LEAAMAAVDPIHFQSIYKIFPGLTLNQATDLCLNSTGATYRDVGELRGVSSETIKKSLEITKSKLELHSVQSANTVFWGRFIVMVCTFYGCKHNSGSLNPAFNRLQLVFPELTQFEIEAVCRYTSGNALSEISSVMKTSEESVESALNRSVITLNASKRESVRFIVISRLIENLTLDVLHCHSEGFF